MRGQKLKTETLKAEIDGSEIPETGDADKKQVAGVTLVSRIFHPGFQTFSPATSTFFHFSCLSNVHQEEET